MTEKKVLLIGILLTVVMIFGGVLLVSQTTATTQVSFSQAAKAITVGATSADWGQIPMNKGNVSKTFTIKNTGTDVLKLYNIRTSCHCTKAEVKTPTDQSPLFGMDSVSSWVGLVPPGQKAQVTMTFDPAYHGPQGVGPINRYVLIETNDSSNSKITFSASGTVFK